MEKYVYLRGTLKEGKRKETYLSNYDSHHTRSGMMENMKKKKKRKFQEVLFGTQVLCKGEDTL